MGETFVEWQLAFRWGAKEKYSNYNCNRHAHVIDAPTQACAHAYKSTGDTKRGMHTYHVISHVWEHGMSDFLQWYSWKSLIRTSVIRIFTYPNPPNNDIHRYFAVH